MSTYEIRKKLVDIARRDKGKTEVTKNQAPWIKRLWEATSYGIDGFKNREPYCAAGVASAVRDWLTDPKVREAFGFATEQEAEKWRCKSASCIKADDSWWNWARSKKGVQVLPPNSILKMGDIVIYDYSHIEIVSDDDGTASGPFTAVGYNTNASGSRDGEGCFEKPRNRARVKCFIRLLQP